MNISPTQLNTICEKIGLTQEFILNRLKANQRRYLITTDILKRRGVDISQADILEVGCHIGFGLLVINTVKSCVGLDYFEGNCHKAKILTQALGNNTIAYITGTAAALPFNTNEFNLIQSHHVLEHLPPEIWPAYIKEMARVLRPEGYCFISFPHFHYPIEGHYKLPFLHWLPKKIRPFYARLTPRYKHIHEAKKTYRQTARKKDELTFTEFPKKKEIIHLAKQNFSMVEDITKEFTRHPLIKQSLGPIKQSLASLLVNTWICPERKMLFYK